MRARSAPTIVAGLVFAVVALAGSGQAAAAVVLQPVTSTDSPVYVTNAGDSRLFIVEVGGRIRVYDPNTQVLMDPPFLDITTKVSTGGERGLFSVAFHPDYASNGYFYVDYTNVNGDTVIDRYHVSANPNLADPNSGVTLLLIAQPFPNHNGGQLQIGPKDGYLYIGMGDGGSDGDPSCYAQRRDTMLGKMLRLNVRANLGQPPYYGIPADNPFIGAADPANQIADEIWAFGLRNPWRFSFDRASGDLFIGDVGESMYEEIDLHRAGVPGGQNYGWRSMEGFHCFDTTGCPAYVPPCNDARLTLPIAEFPHNGDCAITGGYFYRGRRVPELSTRYIFGDYCAGVIRTLTEVTPGNWQSQDLLQTTFGITSFGEDVNGEVYVTVGNNVFQLVSTAPPPPVPAVRLPWLLALGLVLATAGVIAVRRRAGSAT
jgi:glucose/arabinose dehydrogenase